VEWTQRRRARGAAPPMLRLAVEVEEAPGCARRWLVSAAGEGRAHARGCALEYFACTALAPEGQWELRTVAMAAMVWRPLEAATLRVLGQPAAPAALPPGARRARSHCRFAPPFILFIPDSRT
jgi:hypothetical protein